MSDSEGAEKELPNPLQIQQEYFEYFCDVDWQKFEQNEHLYLQKWLAFALFGMPSKDVEEPDTIFGYDKKQTIQIKSLYTVILENCYRRDPTILIRVIFIVCETKEKKKNIFQEPLFILKKCQKNYLFEKPKVPECNVYIDREGRVYDTWKKYLEDNRLPECLMHCPKNGKYTGMIIGNDDRLLVELETHDSPACSLGKKILVGVDIAGAIAGIGSTGVMLAASAVAMAPVAIGAATVTATAVGVYSVGRSISTLVDRALHKQSIGLNNTESRWCWLNATVGTLSTATTAATAVLTSAVKEGVNITQATEVAMNTLLVASAAGNGVSISCSLYDIIKKKINNESVSALEVLQLCASVFFFHQSVINFQTAQTIIKNTQAHVLDDYSKTLRSNRHRRAYRKARLENERIKGEIQGNREMIRGIKKINDPDNFFAGLVRINKDLNKAGVRYTITENGQVALNSAHVIDPAAFANIPRSARQDQLIALPGKPPSMPRPMTNSDFNIKLNEIQDILKVVQRGFQFLNIDVSSVAFLVQDFCQETIKCLFTMADSLLLQLGQEIIERATRLFPLVDEPIIILQFLISYLRQKANEIQIEVSLYVDFFFDTHGDIITAALNEIILDFYSWITNTENKLTQSIPEAEEWARRKVKMFKCKICLGSYFER